MLLAIAYSQILGGVACCCFVSAVRENITQLKVIFASENAACPVNDSDSFIDTASVRCPKCAAQAKKPTANASEFIVDAAVNHKEKAQIAAPCSCSKFSWDGSESNELPSLKTKTCGTEWIVVDFPRIASLGWYYVQASSPPPLLLLGKHSWQSMACIWKN
jgi:hypothetical protein